MLAHFQAIFREIRQHLLEKGKHTLHAVGKNPKGQQTKAFDLFAEQLVVSYCREHGIPADIYGEESGMIRIADDPAFIFILDPVDGSHNFARGIEHAGFSIAALPHGPLRLDAVQYALVGSVFTGTTFTAEKGKGARCSGAPLHASPTASVEQSIVCIDFPYGYEAEKVKVVLPLMREVKYIRKTGAVTLDLSYVASGAYDAYVNARGNCTPENFAAAQLIVQEAGGVFSDAQGNPMGKIDMVHGYNVVAAGNEALHRKIISILNAC